MEPRPPEEVSTTDAEVAAEQRIRALLAEEESMLTPEARRRLEEKAEQACIAELGERRVEVNGVMMTRREWKEFMNDCPHQHFAHPGVTLMDGSPMSICERCKFIQYETIAKLIEGENN